MKRTPWFFHPAFVFIFSVLALGTSLALYIYWYMEVSTTLKALAQRFELDSGLLRQSQAWMVIVVLSILVGVILLGIFTIFVYGQKTLQLYRLQNNFINNFTHELRTPVTSLKLFLETLLKRDHHFDGQQRAYYLGLMLKDVARLSDNITRILDLSRLESKSYQGQFALVDPVETIREFIASSSQLFPGIRVRLDAPVSGARCRLDKGLFDMLLTNLIGNAAKYNTSDQPGVTIGFARRNKLLVIRFADNGMGIAQNDLKRIFGKFYQGARPDSPAIHGSGLGLYLVQQIARLHKGRIAAHSDGPGKGSVFTLQLPLAQP